MVTHKEGAESVRIEGAIADHAVGLTLMRQAFADAGADLVDRGVVAVGHRVVHGGTTFTGPVLVDDTVVEQIGELSVLAPLHNPANLVGIERALANFPHLPHVAVFDTAFFADLPAAAATYAIDHTLAAKHGVRRYGFHGTSHSFVSPSGRRGAGPAVRRAEPDRAAPRARARPWRRSAAAVRSRRRWG